MTAATFHLPANPVEARSQVNAEELRSAIDYDTETGVFTWKSDKTGWTRAGAKAGAMRKDGYVLISINGKRYLAHRLAWLYVHGQWPSKFIDHIDGNPSNNRIANLREVDQSINMQNQRRALSNNKSGLLGVCWSSNARKWHAQINIDGINTHVGYYNTKEEAHAAYIEAKRKSHPGGVL